MGMSLQNVFPSNGRTRDSILSIGEFSVTRLGDFLHFGRSFKSGGNNYFSQIAHIVRQFL